jgi:predicted  nucleic acid-binding Zn-ribbon protein
MSDEIVTNELVYELLKRMNHSIGRIREDVADVKLRLGSMEDHVSSLVVSIVGINHRLDRHETRLERIENRLELIEA